MSEQIFIYLFIHFTLTFSLSQRFSDSDAFKISKFFLKA